MEGEKTCNMFGIFPVQERSSALDVICGCVSMFVCSSFAQM